MIDINPAILSDLWWATTAKDYTFTIMLGLGFIGTLLKIWAVLDPSAKTNTIVELIQGWGASVTKGVKKEGTPKRQEETE